jgi:hypothetical protein
MFAQCYTKDLKKEKRKKKNNHFLSTSRTSQLSGRAPQWRSEAGGEGFK